MDESFYMSITNEELNVRTTAIKGLAAQVEKLGVTRTTEELLPSLVDVGLLDDDDELLLVLASELGTLFDLVDGVNGIGSVLDLLEALAKCEESSVREAAVNAISKIGSQIKDDVKFQGLIIDLVFRLGQSEWYTPKIAACSLFVDALKRGTAPQREKLILLYVDLCCGETPMVRRAAALNLKDIFPLLSPDVILSQFLDVYQAFSKDSQDSVRLLVVEVASSLASFFTEHKLQEKAVELVKPVLLCCAEDKSWRVRYMVASCFVDIANGLGSETTQSVVPVFLSLLKDSESEVRKSAASKISGVCKLIGSEEAVKTLLPCVSKLVLDESQQVRSALASDVMLLAPVFGNEGTSKHLLSIFLQLLKDDIPDVRLNIISKLDQVTSVIGLDKLSEHLMPAMVELAEDKQWRIRLAVMHCIPPLAKQLSAEFFQEKLLCLCYNWLADTVYSVRQAAIANLKELIPIFGEPFCKDCIIPQIIALQSRKNYLHRMTILLFIREAESVLEDSLIVETLLPLALVLAEDPVANVRFASASALEALFKRLDKETLETKIRPILQKLSTDVDIDVRLYANEALKRL